MRSECRPTGQNGPQRTTTDQSTVMTIVEPGLTFWPAPGSCAATMFSPRLNGAFCTETLKPAAVRICCASLVVFLLTFGTSTSGGPSDTTSATLSLANNVPLFGVWLITLPSGTLSSYCVLRVTV